MRRSVLIFIFGLASAALAGCGDDDRDYAAGLTGGDPNRGRAAIEYHGCASCHTIPGVRGADGVVGPPLTNIGSRMYIGGVLQNKPANLVRWIRDPTAVDPRSAMPDLGVDEGDARDIAAYLYSLR